MVKTPPHHGHCHGHGHGQSHHHASFLEELAKEECLHMSRRNQQRNRNRANESGANDHNLDGPEALDAGVRVPANRANNYGIPDNNADDIGNIDDGVAVANGEGHQDDDDEDNERRNFHLLDFGMQDEEIYSDEFSSDDELDFDDDDYDEGDFDDDDSAAGSMHEQDRLQENNGNDEVAGRINDENISGHDSSVAAAPAVSNQEDGGATKLLSSSSLSPNYPSNMTLSINGMNMTMNMHINHNHRAITSLLIRLAQSEENPLIRADIPWHIITSPGFNTQVLSQFSFVVTTPSLLRSLYPATEMNDAHGTKLLQGTLRMDPPYEAVKMMIEAFPTSCLDMEAFFTACQFAHPNTSKRVKVGHGVGSRDQVYKHEDDDDDYDSDSDDVGEVVKLVMHQTIKSRRINNIEWGMVAFLGDARISPSHAKLLLRHTPEALVDSQHGAFGVSPLDRMACGVFIHGDESAWVEKLRLALRTAAYVRWRKEKVTMQEGGEQGKEEDSDGKEKKQLVLPRGFFCSKSKFMRRESSVLSMKASDSATTDNHSLLPFQSFYPDHELIRLLTSPDFRGNKFGELGFLNTLAACTKSDPRAFLRPDNDGNLPIHVALASECNSVLGTKGERRLIRFLLEWENSMALVPEGHGLRDGKERRLPLRMSIENAWPVYDLIINAALASECVDYFTNTRSTQGIDATTDIPNNDYIISNKVTDRPILHDALSGKYHARFGIHGSRLLVKNIITKVTHCEQPINFLDANHDRVQHEEPSGSKKLPVNFLNEPLVPFKLLPQCCLTHFVAPNGRTALHIALEHKWPVYDIILQANPFSLEARDPTSYGFYPFQIAACSFTSRYEETDTEDHGEDGNSHHQHKPLTNEEKRSALIETGMLFELIRENPLCVTSGIVHCNKKPPSIPAKCKNDPNVTSKNDESFETTSGDVDHTPGYSLKWASATDEEDPVQRLKMKKRRRSNILNLLSKRAKFNTDESNAE
ncbi:hypothetical protein ACHAXS_006136 [Conticribra weissflogii]